MKKILAALFAVSMLAGNASADAIHRTTGVVQEISSDGTSITIGKNDCNNDGRVLNFLQNTVSFRKQLEDSLRKGYPVVVITREPDDQRPKKQFFEEVKPLLKK